jgi:signal transduction histidine kinase
MSEPESDRRESSKPVAGPTMGLSVRLMVLTIAFLMLAEFLIWTPSVSRFRKNYLEQHIAEAHLAMIAVEALKSGTVDMDLEKQLLFYTETYGIVLNLTDQRMLMVGDSMPPKVDVDVNMLTGTFLTWVLDAFETLRQPENRVLRVIGKSPKNPTVGVEIIMDEIPMRDAMIRFSWRILGLSVVISLFTAALVYLSLQWLMVRPIRRITRNLGHFRDRPEDAARVITQTARTDELGTAQRELRGMQEEVRHALGQKSRLATLGAAVARVNHDLRNTLATAVLASDRLATIEDPEVQHVMPRLFNSIHRAVRLCSQTLDYVSASDLNLRLEPFHLSELLSEVGGALREELSVMETDGEDPAPQMNWQNQVPFEITVIGDRYQLFRVFHNLALNARMAGADNFTITAAMQAGDKLTRIALTDDGPGLPDRTREQLFQPFAGSSRRGGTGLGLVIAHDIVLAHGGNIDLTSSGTDGTIFQIELPATLDEEE